MNVDALLQATGLTIPGDLTLPDGVRPAAWGRQGDRWVFWFVNPSADELTRGLEAVRAVVNAQYRTPRAMRVFSVPKMVLVAVVERPDPALDEVVRASGTSGWMGGEMFALVSVVRGTGAMVVTEPRGNRNHRLVEQIRLSKLEPDAWARAALAS